MVLIVINEAFLILTITVKVTDEFVTSLKESVTSILKLYVPARDQSVVAIMIFDVGLHVSHATHAPVATFLTL